MASGAYSRKRSHYSSAELYLSQLRSSFGFLATGHNYMALHRTGFIKMSNHTMPKEEFDRVFGPTLRNVESALWPKNKLPEISQLRKDLEFSRQQGLDCVVISTQETIMAILAHIDAAAQSNA